MKRTGIGFFLLGILLLAGLLSTWGMARHNGPIAGQLSQAADAAAQGNWQTAIVLAEDAREEWEDGWHFCACFADHGPMEQIDGLFAQLEIYQKMEDSISFAAACAHLGRQVQAMGDAHGLNWWNFF